MKAARLYGPKDLRIDEIEEPDPPQSGQDKIRVGTVGICGSDMHMYGTGAIGRETIASPMIMGHEFMGSVLEVGSGAFDGFGNRISLGSRVAFEPACHCEECECCCEGNPNLRPNHRF